MRLLSPGGIATFLHPWKFCWGRSTIMFTCAQDWRCLKNVWLYWCWWNSCLYLASKAQWPQWKKDTANQKHPYTTRTLANGQSVREDYGRFQECKGGIRGDFTNCLTHNFKYHAKSCLEYFFLSHCPGPECCFPNHESLHFWLPVGPSFRDSARVRFSHFEGDN